MRSRAREHNKTDEEVMQTIRQVVGTKDRVPTSDLIKVAMWIWETNEEDATDIVSKGGLLQYIHPAPTTIQCHDRLEQGYMRVNAGAFFIALKQNMRKGDNCTKMNVNVVNRQTAVWGAKLTAHQVDDKTMGVSIHPKKFTFDFGKVVENPTVFITYDKTILFEYPVTHASAREVILEFDDTIMEFKLDPDKCIPHMPKLTLVS